MKTFEGFPDPKFELTTFQRPHLKTLAFTYFYGQWRSEEDAYASLAYSAAREMASREEWEVFPKPNLIGIKTDPKKNFPALPKEPK